MGLFNSGRRPAQKSVRSFQGRHREEPTSFTNGSQVGGSEGINASVPDIGPGTLEGRAEWHCQTAVQSPKSTLLLREINLSGQYTIN